MIFNLNYGEYLKQIVKKRINITFDELIEEAIKLQIYEIHYKYVLIDEYQDISNQRFILIKKYVEKENSKLMCVGDDWQTIFSFASSDISKILNFNKMFIDVKILKILMTYRNSQELVNIAGLFVMQNKKQIKKNLKSIKHLINPIELIYYSNQQTFNQMLPEKIEELLKNNYNVKIAIISRYKFDINEIIDKKLFNFKDTKLFYKTKEIYYYTIYTSKGLGFDYVFILNNKKGYYGFPSKRRSNNLFKEENAYFEERRLFYVALTRTKNKVFLMIPSKQMSVFSKEIKKILKKNKYLI